MADSKRICPSTLADPGEHHSALRYVQLSSNMPLDLDDPRSKVSAPVVDSSVSTRPRWLTLVSIALLHSTCSCSTTYHYTWVTREAGYPPNS